MNFTGIPMVATAISVVICWALFAILCSLVHEAVAQVKAERGRYMKKYLLQQLADNANGVNWGSLIYMHGSVDLLSRAHNKPTSDIAPCLFAETLIDVVGKSHIVQSQAPLIALTDVDGRPIAPYSHHVLRDFKAATLVLQPSDVVTMLKQAMHSAELSASDAGEDESKVYEGLVHYMENWFAQFNERLNVWYKKKVRRWLFVIGIILGIFFNVDSIQLFQYFNENVSARERVMNYYADNAPRLNDLANSLSNPNIDTATKTDIKAIIRQTRNYALEMDTLAKQAGLPIGPSKFHWDWKEFPDTFWGKLLAVLFKLAGILVTGFAASFGAPFWFDLLKRVYQRK